MAILVPAARSIIVDVGFVKNVLGGASPLGRRVRIGRDSNEWYEIVGVVKDLGMNSPIERSLPAGLYLPALPGHIDSPQLLIHASGDPLSLSPRIRAIAESVDPTMRLSAFTRMDRVSDPMVWFVKLWRQITMILTGIAVLLSLAGIYAVLAFTVSKRTREIGVRIALGATPRLVATTIFRRPLTQVSIGIGVGAVLVGLGTVVVRNHKPDGELGMHILAGGMSAGHFCHSGRICRAHAGRVPACVYRAHPTRAWGAANRGTAVRLRRRDDGVMRSDGRR
jgi:putative ABC transport system permease protein